MPTAQQILTVSRGRLTLMAMVMFIFLIKSFFKLDWFENASVFFLSERLLTGRRTGRCVQYYNYTFKTCEIQSWCPVEEYAVVR